MGPANGISCSPCERAAFRTAAGPGPVDASGWSLTWKWDSTEGWTQGKRIHTRGGIITIVINSQNNRRAMWCWQILSSKMTEAPQPCVTASKKEEMVISTERAFKAASEDTNSSELPIHEWVLCVWFDNTHIKTLQTVPGSYSKTTQTITINVI